MYQVLKAGGRLDSEFFPESIGRRSFATVEAYSAFLRKRRRRQVILFANYDARWSTNEHALLEELASIRPVQCHAGRGHGGGAHRPLRRLQGPAHLLAGRRIRRRPGQLIRDKCHHGRYASYAAADGVGAGSIDRAQRDGGPEGRR